jgi:hypothetical protein
MGSSKLGDDANFFKPGIDSHDQGQLIAFDIVPNKFVLPVMVSHIPFRFGTELLIGSEHDLNVFVADISIAPVIRRVPRLAVRAMQDAPGDDQPKVNFCKRRWRFAGTSACLTIRRSCENSSNFERF